VTTELLHTLHTVTLSPLWTLHNRLDVARDRLALIPFFPIIVQI